MLAGRNLHVHDQPAIERHDEPDARLVHVEPAHDGGGPALQDADDAPFGAIVARPLDARDDPIAVHGLIQVAPGDIQIPLHVLQRPIRHHEAETPRMGHHSSDNQVHPVGEAEPVASRFHEVAALDEVGKEAFEYRALLPGQLQGLQQLTRGGRVVQLVPNQRQDLLVIQHSHDFKGDGPKRHTSSLLYSNRTPRG